MITATRFLNKLIKELNFKSFCEIGYANGNTTERIQLPYEGKVSMDPAPDYSSSYFKKTNSGHECIHDLRIMPSDEFFQTNKRIFDLFLIDGDHTYNQAYKDINNSLKFLSPNGVIFCHDAAPLNFILTQDGNKRCGDVYKALMRLRAEKNDLSVYALNEYNTPPPDNSGFGIVFKQKQQPWKEEIDIDNINFHSYQYMKENKDLLSFLKFQEVLKLIKERNKKL